MGSFVSFAFIGGMGVMAVLIWRLYVAVGTQHDMETSFASTSETLETERLTATQQAQTQIEKADHLTSENQALRQQSEEQLKVIHQLQSDHQALQEKYSELEQNLLGNIAQGKVLSSTLQTYKLENAKLQRQTKSLEKSQTEWEKEQQTLLNRHQEISEKHQKYQKLIQAAKETISHLEKEKKQLERDLQQALLQVLALEQEQKSTPELVHNEDLIDTYKNCAVGPCLPTFQS